MRINSIRSSNRHLIVTSHSLSEVSAPICIPDNHPGKSLELLESQWEDLSVIAGKKISVLCRETDDESRLLVFPDSLEEYGDRIGDSIIINISGQCISSGNVMGFIGRRDTLLKIHSRFDREADDFFMHYMLEKVFSINMFDLPHSTDTDQVFDFIVFLFPYFLKKALGQGLHRKYVTCRRNDAHVRGSIDIARHISSNLPFTGRIAYNSRERSADNEMTELIRHTIEFIRNKPFGQAVLSRDEDTKECVSAIIQATPAYRKKDRAQVIYKNLRPKVHPFYFEYEPLRRLCLQILREEEIKYGEKDDRVYGVLFDGAWLWEEYLNTLFDDLEIHHPENKSRRSPIHLFWPRRAERYPDFWTTGLVMDAKYKGYDGKPVYKIGTDDLAQVISYMYILEAHFGGFLVPGKDGQGNYTCETLNGYGGELFLLSLPIPSGSVSYSDFIEKIRLNEESFVETITKLL